MWSSPDAVRGQNRRRATKYRRFHAVSAPPERPGDNGVMTQHVVEWSSEVGEAAWIADRLSPFDSGVVTSVVPTGFEAYARLLHPAEEPLYGDRLVRWAQVAAWSGVALLPATQFHDIALPEHQPAAPAPWSGHAPGEGTLYAADLDVLAGLLVDHTATPERCWFCLWDGYGWETDTHITATSGDDPDSPDPRVAIHAKASDPIPAAVRAGPRVRLPNRTYLLYTGPIAAAWAFVDSHDQTPTLWWPADRAWCVASEIDLPWTYVGGPATLITRLVAEPRVEAQLVSAGDSHYRRVQGWLAQAIEQTADELLDSGEATLRTWRGTLRTHLQRPQRQCDGFLRTEHEDEDPISGARSGSSWMRLNEPEPDSDRLHDVITHSLTNSVIDSLVA